MSAIATTAVASRPDTLAADGVGLQDHLDQIETTLGDLRDQLRVAQKLAGLGTMSTILAHEYNNLATPVLSYAQHALETGDPAFMGKALETVVRRLRAIGSLSRRILDYAGDQGNHTGPVELRTVVEHALETLARDLAKDRITVSIRVDEGLTVQANANELEQVLFNLVLNARQAMHGRKGTLTLEATPRSDGLVALAVKDSGPGIDPSHIDSLFTPFFTTKGGAERADQRGVGLGLAVCKTLIESAGGCIDVASTLGEGTTFTITLPAAISCQPSAIS